MIPLSIHQKINLDYVRWNKSATRSPIQMDIKHHRLGIGWCTARLTDNGRYIFVNVSSLTFDVVTEASVHAQFMLPLSNVRETNALVVASAIILTPLSVVLPVNVTTNCWTSFSRVADTVRSCKIRAEVGTKRLLK